MTARVINDPGALGWVFDPATGRWEWGGSDDGGGSGGGAWEHIETISADGVAAIEVDIPPGYDRVRATVSLWCMRGNNPSDDSAAAAIRGVVKNAGAWLDGSSGGHPNPYYVNSYGVENNRAILKGSNRAQMWLADERDVWGPMTAVYEFSNYQGSKPDDSAYIRFSENLNISQTNAMPVATDGMVTINTSRLYGNGLNIEGFRIYIWQPNHSFSDSRLILEGLRK